MSRRDVTLTLVLMDIMMPEFPDTLARQGGFEGRFCCKVASEAVLDGRHVKTVQSPKFEPARSEGRGMYRPTLSYLIGIHL